MAHGSQATLSDIERAAVQILLERQLASEVNAINMGLTEIRTALGGRKATINYGPHGETFVNLPDRSIQVMPGDSADDIKAKLTNPFEQTETSMSVSGLAPGMLQAKLAELRKRGQERLAQGVAKIDAAHTSGLSKIDAASDDAVKKIDAEIDAALHEFAESTNGGPS